jgi:hypothetical protein
VWIMKYWHGLSNYFTSTQMRIIGDSIQRPCQQYYLNLQQQPYNIKSPISWSDQILVFSPVYNFVHEFSWGFWFDFKDLGLKKLMGRAFMEVEVGIGWESWILWWSEHNQVCDQVNLWFGHCCADDKKATHGWSNHIPKMGVKSCSRR